MLSREEDLINNYLDGYLIEDLVNRFSISQDEITLKIIDYRTKRVMKLINNFEYTEDNLNIIGAYIGESIYKINGIVEIDRRRMIRNIVKLSEDGMTLESMSKIFHLTRERIRQLVKKYSPELSIAGQVKRLKDCEICNKKTNGVSRRGYYKAICEKCYKKILKNNKNRWSREFDKCIDCGTTEVPHRIKGRCIKCHSIFSYHYDLKRRLSIKKSGDKWRVNHIERVKEINKKAADKIKEKLMDGNRILAIERDGYKCTKCGIGNDQSVIKFKRKLYVSHIGSLKDNSLDNLITLCSACHNSLHSRSKLTHKK